MNYFHSFRTNVPLSNSTDYFKLSALRRMEDVRAVIASPAVLSKPCGLCFSSNLRNQQVADYRHTHRHFSVLIGYFSHWCFQVRQSFWCCHLQNVAYTINLLWEFKCLEVPLNKLQISWSVFAGKIKGLTMKCIFF